MAMAAREFQSDVVEPATGPETAGHLILRYGLVLARTASSAPTHRDVAPARRPAHVYVDPNTFERRRER